jgi:hypothetical protein
MSSAVSNSDLGKFVAMDNSQMIRFRLPTA